MGQQVIEIVDKLVELAVKLAARVFGFTTSMVSRWKSPVPYATQTHKPKTSVVPSGSTALVNLNDAIKFAGGSYLARQLSVFYRLPTEVYTRGGEF
jgi:hypothetical protein